MFAVKKPNILVIEDDAWMATIYADALGGQANLQIASNLNDAVDLLENNDFAVIIADILLAGETIFTLLNELQSDVKLAKIPVIIASNTATRLPQKNLTNYGIVDVLDKAKMTPEDIRASLRRVL